MTAYWKSILAALAAGIASLVTATTDGSVSVNEWLIALGAVIVALSAVGLIPNAGFVNLNKASITTLGPAVYEAYASKDWQEATLEERRNAATAADAVLSALRR